MVEEMKRAVASAVSSVVNVYSTYPQKQTEVPCATLDVVTMTADRYTGAEMRNCLVRISIFSDNRLELDQLVDNVIDALKTSSLLYLGVSSMSPIMPFDRFYKRDIDIKVVEITE